MGRDNDHMLELNAEFPGLEMFGPQCIGAHVGPGWRGILRDAFTAISAVHGKLGQVKQKFGGLRIYWDRPCGDDGFFLPDTDGAVHRAHEAVALAERMSFSICELCGDPPLPVNPTHGRYQTLCVKCVR
jgi:hypothetical protein